MTRKDLNSEIMNKEKKKKRQEADKWRRKRQILKKRWQRGAWSP